MIGALILAAGESARMGRPKQLLSYRGRSLVRHVAETALDSGCRPVLVVLGAHGERIESELSSLDVQTVPNAGWAEGMASSIRAGIRELQQRDDPVEAAVLLTCDQPLLRADVLKNIVEAYRHGGKPIVTCEYAGTLGIPTLFDRSFFPELLELTGDRGAKRIVLENDNQLARVPWPDGAVDVNTPSEYRALTERKSPDPQGNGCERGQADL